MIYLFKILYTYQTIGKEIIKEEEFFKRIQFLKLNKEKEYQQCIRNQTIKQARITNQIKDIVFDYFNLISKEYEVTYEKWKNDEEYKKAIETEKEYVDSEFVNKKF